MKLSISDAKKHRRLVSWIKLLGAMNEEMTLTINDEGISARSMDSSHVEMIDCTIPPSTFDDYVIDEEVKVTVSITELKKVLERFDMNKDTTMIITHDVEKAQLLLKASRSDKRLRQFSVNLMDPLEDEMPEPKIMYNASVRIILEDFEEALISANMYTENVVFILTESTEPMLRVEGKGDLGAYWDEITAIEGTIKDDCKATYTMSYLTELVKALKPLSEMVTLHMSTDMPLHLNVELEGKLLLWLAPCIGA